MQKSFPARVILFLFVSSLTARSQPALSIRLAAAQTVQVDWASAATGFVLEQTSTPSNPSSWQQVSLTPVLDNDRLSVRLPISAVAQFFRLRQPSSTSIVATSPVDGETGVAVTRETIVRFSGALAANATVTGTNFYATAASRRILSRIEPSSDRTKVSLFYLEPLPGSARVSVFFDGAGLNDALGRPLDPAGTGTPYGLKVISFDTLSLTPLGGTAVIGTVYASELVAGPDTGTNAVNKALAGVTITVDGMEQTLRTVTDAMGNFKLEPVPPGRFFVHIDGRTVVNDAAGIHYPDKSYYPFVGKAWEAVAGRTDNPAGGTGTIYLPLIVQGTLQPVSMTTDTVISFPASVVSSNPALAGVSITMPANSLFSDDGTRGGKVGIAPVPPDRLPGPLPPGLELPIVITVQTDGPLNFDKPAPVCFPNLPDPVLGTPLPAGSKQALISFNHKKGIWEAVGSMTVSADGKMICTDPGVGILQPGWHGVGPAPQKPKPQCSNCCPITPGGPSPTKPLSPEREVSLMGQPSCPCNGASSIADCANGCGKKFAQDKENYREWFKESLATCQRFESYFGPNDSRTTTCWAIHRQEEIQKSQKIYRDYADCIGGCQSCPPEKHNYSSGDNDLSRGKRGTLTVQNSPGDLDSEIDSIIAKIQAALEPYALRWEDVPTNVVEDITAFFDQADVLAGGDLLSYLNGQITRLEREIATTNENADLIGTTDPPYPIPYVATVLRNGDFFYLRGETLPFGEYSLFVPRDGKLLTVDFYDPKTKTYASIFPYRRPEAPFALSRFELAPLDASAADFDRDGVSDLVELVYGTDPTNTDSDGDGIPDGAEVDQGTNPLDGRPAQNGIVATIKTPGPAVDICAANDLVITAEGTSGVSVFNAYTGSNPTIIAHVPATGNARRVACEGNFVAVAETDAGVEVIDVSNPAAARVLYHQVLPNSAQALAVGGGVAYVGNGNALTALDLATGRVGNQILVTNDVRDLVLAGDYLYALTDDRLYAISVLNNSMTLIDSAASPYSLPTTRNQRLFVAGGIAYAVQGKGYNTFDLTDPSHPVLIKAGDTTQFGWRQMVANGSGLGLAVIGPASGEDSQRDISLYDLSSPTNTDAYVTTFPMPGFARAVTIYNALAYVAADAAGLQVVNYLAYDSKQVPPKINLTASFPLNSPRVQENAYAWVAANTTDDVQVRNVEFYIDGTKAFSDGNFPFEYRFKAPDFSATKTNFTLQARAVDTGGNATLSEVLTVSLLPDTTALQVAQITPRGYISPGNAVSATFTKPIAAASLTPSALQLFAAGADGALGTADDVLVAGGTVSLQSGSRGAMLSFANNLALGKYRLMISTAITDHYGTHLPAAVTGEFQVIAPDIYWINPYGGDWSDPHNWNTGALPQPTDNVLIAAVPLPIVITHGRGDDAIRSLICQNPLFLSGGSLTVTETMEVDHLFRISGQARLAQATILPSAGSDGLVMATGGILDHVTVNTEMTVPDSALVFVFNGLKINGTLTLGVQNGGAHLLFSNFTPDPQSLSGSGQLVFGDTVERNLLDLRVPVTIESDLTIGGGHGFIDDGNSLINQGTIRADAAGSKGITMTIRGRPFTNQGTLEVLQGGVLELSGSWTNAATIRVLGGELDLADSFTLSDIGKIERTGGTIKIRGTLENTGTKLALNASTGSWVLDNPGTIRGGNIATADGAGLEIPVYGIFDSVTLDSNLTLGSGAILYALKSLTLNGILAMTNGGNPSQLWLDGSLSPDLLAALKGNGQIIFDGQNAANLLRVTGNLVIEAGLTIHGRGATIGTPGYALTNNATIIADVPGGALAINGTPLLNQGTIEVKSGATLSLDGNWANAGTLRVTQGELDLRGPFTTAGLGKLDRTGGVVKLVGTLDNTDATLTLNANTGSWVLGGGTIRGGHVRFADGAALQFSPGFISVLDGVTLDSDWTIPDGAALGVNGGLTINAALTLASANAQSRLSFGFLSRDAETLSGSGRLIFGGSGQNLVDVHAPVIIAAGFTIRGASGLIDDLQYPLINNGTIQADVAGQNILVLGSPFTNNGTLKADGAGTTITVRASSFTNNGAIQELNGGKVLINP